MAAGGADGQGGRQARVLLVDDEQAIRTALSRALVAEGLAIELAESGSEGLRRALTEAYDLVILDLLMSGMDGLAVLRQLLRDRPWQPVMVLSGLADPQSKMLSLSLGAGDYVPKPFHVGELVARVRARPRAATRTAPGVFSSGRLRLDIVHQHADAGGPASCTGCPGKSRQTLVVEHHRITDPNSL